MEISVLTALNTARLARRAAAMVTDVAAGTSVVFIEGEPVEDASLSNALSLAFRTGKSSMRLIAEREVFFNVYFPPPRVVIVGAVHIAQALAAFVSVCRYNPQIIDPRAAFATTSRFPGVELITEWPEEVFKEHPLDAHTAVAAITHDPKIDDLVLGEALTKRCFYVGALGSRKTHAKRAERMRESGFSDEDIARIDAPIGLDIGAATPEEIGLAIAAQIVHAYRKRRVEARQETGGPQ